MTSSEHVNKILSEHGAVRQIVGSVGHYFNDLDAFFRLQTERFDLSQTSLEALEEKKGQLAETIETLWRDLKKHFAYEEEHLAGVLGETLTAALKMEHEEIGAEIEKVKAALLNVSLEGLDQTEVLGRKNALQNAVGRLSGMIEEHARDEEVLVKMVKKVTGHK